MCAEAGVREDWLSLAVPASVYWGMKSKRGLPQGACALRGMGCIRQILAMLVGGGGSQGAL